MKYKDKIILILIVFFSNYFLDRITKILAIKYLKGKETLHFFWNTVILEYAENEGAFLGAGSNLSEIIKPLLLIVIPVIFCVSAILYCLYKEEDKLSIIFFISIVAGGIANIQDRIFNDGRVTDFLNFGIGNLRTGILNVADMSITFGAILLVINEVLKETRH